MGRHASAEGKRRSSLQISAAILAAGQATRMGRPKLLLSLGGKAIVTHVMDSTARAAVDEVVVVVKPGDLRILREARQRGIRAVYNRAYREGISTSIRVAVQKISPQADGLLILLGDQPFVSLEVINILVRMFAEGRGLIVASRYDNGVVGVPALFHRRLFPELLCLRGDKGARSIIDRHGDETWFVPVPAGQGIDVDTWSDYEALTGQEGAQDPFRRISSGGRCDKRSERETSFM